MGFTGTNWTTARLFTVVLGFTLVAVVVLPLLGVALEAAKPTTRFPAADRFLVFEGILYAVSGIVCGGVVWALTTKHYAPRLPWAVVLPGVMFSILVPLVLVWALPASMTSYFLVYALVTAPTLLGAYLVALVVLTRRRPTRSTPASQ